jgi:hypothetical protein
LSRACCVHSSFSISAIAIELRTIASLSFELLDGLDLLLDHDSTLAPLPPSTGRLQPGGSELQLVLQIRHEIEIRMQPEAQRKQRGVEPRVHGFDAVELVARSVVLVLSPCRPTGA